MTERAAGPIEREIAALEAEIGQAASPVTREQVKRRIVAIYKETEAGLNHFESLRERIKILVERYKQGAADTTRDPQMVEHRPPVRADHLGASTFIEKGWSLIALGDHAAAEQALTRALELAPGDLQAASLLGWAQMLGHKFDEALSAFSRVLAEEPTNALARVNVGYICLKKRIFGRPSSISLGPSASTTIGRRYSMPITTWAWCISSGKWTSMHRPSSRKPFSSDRI